MSSKPGSKRHVLVVDDDEDDIFFLSKLISDQFPNVTLTSINKSTQVMSFLTDTIELPNLIFVDMRMPEVSGLELLRQIRQQSRLNPIPVVVWSGYISSQTKIYVMNQVRLQSLLKSHR